MADVRLVIDIDASGVISGRKVISRELDKLGKKADKTGKGVGRSFQSMGRSIRSVKSAFVGLAAFFAVREIIDYTDRITLLQGRLAVVTETTEEAVAIQKKLLDLTIEARTPLEGAVNLYTRLARTTKELGIEQSKVLLSTELINKAVTVSGASAKESGAALFQLSQGLAANALRGQELNSVLEQTPRVAQAIAAGMGVTIGELRKLAEAGELTAEAVIGAINSQAEAIESEFAQMPRTVGQSIIQLQNQLLNLAENFQGLTDVVISGVDTIRDFAETVDFYFSATKRAASAQAQFNELIKPNLELLNRANVEMKGLNENALTLEAVAKALENAAKLGIDLEFENELRAAISSVSDLESGLAALESKREVNFSVQQLKSFNNVIEDVKAQLDSAIDRRDELLRSKSIVGPKEKEFSLAENLEADARAAVDAFIEEQQRATTEAADIEEKRNEELLDITRGFYSDRQALDVQYWTRRTEIQNQALLNSNVSAIQETELLKRLDEERLTQLEEIDAREIAAEQDRIAAKIELLGIEHTAREAEIISFTERKMALENQFLLDESITAQEHNTEMEILEKNHQRTLTDITVTEATRRKQIIENTLSSVASIFGSITNILGASSKKQFEQGKKFARAQALVSGAVAVMRAWELPWPANIAAGIAAVATTSAQLTQINRTQFGGGGSISAGAAGGGGGAVPPPATVLQQPALQRRDVIINFHGTVLASDASEVVADLLAEADDKDLINITFNGQPAVVER